MWKITGLSMADIGYPLKIILNIALTVEGMSLYSMRRATVNDSQANIK